MRTQRSRPEGCNFLDTNVDQFGAARPVISVPKFKFIGIDQPTFKVAVEDGGVLSWATRDIDKVQMVNEILNGHARQKYIDTNKEVLEEQTKVFYNRLVTSIDPAIVTRFEFRS